MTLPNGPIGIAPGYRFQWEEAQQAYVLLYPEGMVKLSPTAGEILKRCDGAATLDTIVADLQCQFPNAELAGDGVHFLADDGLDLPEHALAKGHDGV